MNRLLDLKHKAWAYLVAALARPHELPSIFWLTAIKHVHAGELLKLYVHKTWLRNAGIRTVIDIGAHTGEFASAIVAILPDALIYSFEPLPDCNQKLAKRLAKHKKFQNFCVALGERSEETTFWRSNFSKSSSVLPMSHLHKITFPWTAKNTQMTIQMQKLDDFHDKMKLAPRVLLKIDVQGYEHRVLQGGLHVLRYIDYVLVETSSQVLYENQSSFHDVYDLLIAEGFEYTGNMDQLISPLDGAILQVDALFSRRQRIRRD